MRSRIGVNLSEESLREVLHTSCQNYFPRSTLAQELKFEVAKTTTKVLNSEAAETTNEVAERRSCELQVVTCWRIWSCKLLEIWSCKLLEQRQIQSYGRVTALQKSFPASLR